MNLPRRSFHLPLRAVVAALGLVFIPGLLAAEETAPQKPLKFASLCVQGDQLLLELVPREQIVALSHLAIDLDISVHANEARGIPLTSGGAEELAMLRPDVVLMAAYSMKTAAKALKERGVRVIELGIPNDFDELRALIRQTGADLGAEARAEALIAQMDARLERILARRPPPEKRPAAMFYFQDGFTPGAKTFCNALLEAAGFRNLGSHFSPGVGASAPLEAVLMARPQLLVLTRYREARPAQTQTFPLQLLFTKLGTQVTSVSFVHLASPDPANLELAEKLQQYLPQ
ncbi:MAG: ABC transporter substrate-binding protein [Chthoniobacteraceae bacterium]